MLQGLAVAFGVVFVAELGDKSQLLAMTLAARYRPWAVLAGIAVATLILQGLAVAVGTLIGDRLPTRPIQFVAGLAFLQNLSTHTAQTASIGIDAGGSFVGFTTLRAGEPAIMRLTPGTNYRAIGTSGTRIRVDITEG